MAEASKPATAAEAKAADTKAEAAAAKAGAAKPDKGDKAERDAALKEKAPGLTKEFIAEYKLDDEYLDRIAAGLEPPPPLPPANAPSEATAGGWQITHKGDKPEDVGKDAISR
jgi:hypothetical protein